MNRAILMGRLTKDPEIRATQNGDSIARYTLAVDRRGDGTDFIRCVTFKKSAEFAEKYLKKGMKICVTGRIQTGSYTNKDGTKVYTTDVIVDDQEFAENKNAKPASDQDKNDEGFMRLSGDDLEGLPFA